MSTELFSPEALRDPHPVFAELRAEAPVMHHPDLDVWTVARHADVVAVLRAAKVFSSALGMGELMAGRLDPRRPELPRMDAMMGPLRIVIATDPPDHTKLRRLSSAPFGAREVVYLEPRIRALCEELVDGLLRSDAPDLVTDVAVPLPVIVIAELLGIPTDRRADFKRWSNDMVGGLSGDLDLATRQQSAFEMFEFFSQAIDERSREPGDDVISRLVGRSHDLDTDDRLSVPELVAFCILLLIAGNETTTNLIANAAHAFFANPDQWDRLHRDPSLAPAAVEEALRFDGPVKALLRMPAEDTAIGDVAIPAGARVMPLFSSANRDERVFDDPDRFDIERRPEDHVAFGYGIHHCLGAPLARLETRILLDDGPPHPTARGSWRRRAGRERDPAGLVIGPRVHHERVTEVHRLTRIDTVGGDAFISHCSCGWRSRRYSTAGMAGSAQTQHSEQNSPTDVG